MLHAVAAISVGVVVGVALALALGYVTVSLMDDSDVPW